MTGRAELSDLEEAVRGVRSSGPVSAPAPGGEQAEASGGGEDEPLGALPQDGSRWTIANKEPG